MMTSESSLLAEGFDTMYICVKKKSPPLRESKM